VTDAWRFSHKARMISQPIRSCFAAAPHVPRLPEAEVRRKYPRYRWRVMEATFIGYSTFYLVRNNLAVVAKDMRAALHYDASMIGSILAITAITYGLGKFVMGAVSDRSNPRTFMASGLLATAICNFIFGSVASYPLHLGLWAMNGFFQGMGWPPCGRSMGHWFSKKERGLWFSVWNASTNFGGGLAGALAGWSASYFGGWQYAFFVPGVIATIGAVYLFLRLCDTPQSVGLPPIEEYGKDYGGAGALICARCGYAGKGARPRCPECGEPFDESLLLADPPPLADLERELTFKELFVDYVLTNKYVWLLAIANFFAYITRYSMLDWGPTYLREMKGATLTGGGVAILIAEWGGIPSTIALGWLSDLFGGRRGTVAVVCMLPVLAAFMTILFTPAGYLWLDMTMLGIVGFFVYPVLNLILIMALDLTSKKAVGTAAGFIGLFGYIGRMTQAQGFGLMQKHLKPIYGQHATWDMILYSILGCAALGILLLAFTWKLRPKA
jgi:OPA family glycerol-3-phosphate transporter-like MFS transporter